MIKFLRGRIFEKLESCIVLDTGNIGYQINLPLNSPFFTAEISEEVLVYTELIVREDDMSLYGFEDFKTLNFFNLLMNINGVGAKASLALLSVSTVDELARAIASKDTAFISRANGIGKKTAERIALELSDKVESIAYNLPSNNEVTSVVSGNKAEACEALVSLGYNKNEAVNVLKSLDEGLDTQSYIRKALTLL